MTIYLMIAMAGVVIGILSIRLALCTMWENRLSRSEQDTMEKHKEGDEEQWK